MPYLKSIISSYEASSDHANELPKTLGNLDLALLMLNFGTGNLCWLWFRMKNTEEYYLLGKERPELL